jgi:flagellar motility protein MotE (MotC chaperone)
VDKFKYQQHDIVHFKDRKMAFSECAIHLKQKCVVYCEQCDVPVCTKCLIGPHKGHDAVELSDIIESKKQEIKKEIQEIESTIIPRYKQKMENAENKLSVTTERFNELEKEREQRRKLWLQCHKTFEYSQENSQLKYLSPRMGELRIF